MSTDDWTFEALTLAAIDAHSVGETEVSWQLWLQCEPLAQSFAGDDPRRATAMNNAALAHHGSGNLDCATELWHGALKAWEASAAFVERMSIPVAAHSSTFHLRMEQRHRESYATFKRQRLSELLAGAKAITMCNLALAYFARDADTPADGLLARAVEERRAGFGHSDPHLQIMLGLLAGRQDMLGQSAAADATALEARRIASEPARSALELWGAERPRGMNDLRRVLAAAYLTVMAEADW